MRDDDILSDEPADIAVESDEESTSAPTVRGRGRGSRGTSKRGRARGIYININIHKHISSFFDSYEQVVES